MNWDQLSLAEQKKLGWIQMRVGTKRAGWQVNAISLVSLISHLYFIALQDRTGRITDRHPMWGHNTKGQVTADENDWVTHVCGCHAERKSEAGPFSQRLNGHHKRRKGNCRKQKRVEHLPMGVRCV